VCIIINNQEFNRNDLKRRDGSDKDRAEDQQLLRLTTIVFIRKPPSSIDCMLPSTTRCLISSPRRHIASSEDVKNGHYSCPSLAGKPKLFFLQACQGDKNMVGGVQPQVDSSKASEVKTLPIFGDFLIGHCTYPGYLSYRYLTGSIYIKTLCEQLRKLAHSCDILTILTMVNLEVSKWEGTYENNRVKQMPAPRYMLRKLLFLTPSESKT
ncbi:hypothetical protein DPMN_152578, partial [Dreissena polymorpha]